MQNLHHQLQSDLLLRILDFQIDLYQAIMHLPLIHQVITIHLPIHRATISLLTPRQAIINPPIHQVIPLIHQIIIDLRINQLTPHTIHPAIHQAVIMEILDTITIITVMDRHLEMLVCLVTLTFQIITMEHSSDQALDQVVQDF